MMIGSKFLHCEVRSLAVTLLRPSSYLAIMLIEDHDEARRLNDFERKKAVGVDSGNAVREAARQRIIDVIASHA